MGDELIFFFKGREFLDGDFFVEYFCWVGFFNDVRNH